MYIHIYIKDAVFKVVSKDCFFYLLAHRNKVCRESVKVKL